MDGLYDVVIAGGAVMGASAAFWLSRMDPALKIAVVEADPSFSRSSTALSVASVRQQFSQPVNVKISRFGIDFIRNISGWTGTGGGVADLGLHENGYLFLAGDAAAGDRLEALADMQRSLGAATTVLGRAGLAQRFPYLALDDVICGSFGPKDEGWFDNMGLLGALRAAAKAAGVRFVTDRVTGLEEQGGRVTGVTLASGGRFGARAVVNAMGTRAADLLRNIAQDLPVEPRKRTVFLIDAPDAPFRDAPLLVDHTGFYLRPEGAHWLCATVPENDTRADPEDFEPELHQFEELVWPRLYARSARFAAVKVLRAWAGHYAFNTLDQNAIVGRWPSLDGLYLMNGFSGHGLQQAPAMGRGIAELILHGQYQSLDLSALGPERILTRTPLYESAIV